MDKDTRNAIERATQRARKLLEEDFAAQLEGDFDVHKGGAVAAKAGGHLSARQAFQRERIVAAIEHKRAAGMSAADAARDYLRDAAFTTLNRFVALKMLEARDVVQECITRGEQSAGYREFCGMAPGIPLLPDSAGYRLYIESLFDELSTEVKVLFDRRDPSSVLWPRRATFEQLLEILNVTELARVWGEDETIGWVYQFFNGQDERRKMREESQAPRNSRELAVRNQFFTPRYVVQFLTDNTLGRIWYEMRGTKTALADKCDYMVRKPGEAFVPRAKKDPRDLRVLDPACGSGHFLLYAFDLLLTIYEEAYADRESPKSVSTGKTLVEDYTNLDALRKALPGLVLAYNLYGVDIDARCAQIAQLTLWMRAQRAYRDFGIGRAERMQLRRSNIVLAEPLVADEKIANEFVAKLNDEELTRVFTALIESLNLAGDMGLLLRVEKLVKAWRNQGELFAPPEKRIRAALSAFIAESAAATSTRRRLFVDDAGHGIGLHSLAVQQYDVVLMNPPFGAPSEAARLVFGEHYPDSKTDVYGAFLERAMEMLAPNGACGAITPRSYLYQVTFEKLRRKLATCSSRPQLICELGLGVLDGATVRVALTVLGGAGAQCSYVRRQLGQSELDCITAFVRDSTTRHHGTFQDFLKLPSTAFLFGLSVSMRRSLLANGPRLKAWNGLQSCDDFRFIRLRSELSPDRDDAWRAYLKPAAFAPYVAPTVTVVNWRRDGREIKAMIAGRGESPSRYCNNESLYPASAAWYPDVSERGIGIARVAEPAIPSRTGIAVSTSDGFDTDAIVGFGNSLFVEGLVGILTPDRHHKPSYVGAVPVPKAIVHAARALARLTAAISELIPPRGPLDGRYRGPFLFVQSSGSVASAISQLVETCERVRGLISQIDQAVIDALELSHEDIELLASSSARGDAIEWFPYLSERNPERELVTEALVHSSLKVLHARPNGIATNDEGHEADLSRALYRELEEVGAGKHVEHYCHILGTPSLREYCLDPKALFSDVLAAFTAGGRKAPACWQIGTPSASYSLWLYIHAFSKDTLFCVQNDYVVPKLAHEERRLESLTREQSDGATAAQRKTLFAQEAVVGELRAFLDEVKRVAPLWKPNLDDGVIINFAPLWRLVPQNKSWQKELKSTWDALCEGKYDWAHLAMHLWPERVVPKCAKDRSIAIAHGLEDVFWVEGTDGRWNARKTPTRSVDELVRERTSPAVKSALKSLLEAPAAAGKSGGRRGGSRRKSAAAAEGGGA